MPPKNSGESKKTEKKKIDKVIEDKTFGLKNKNKSKTVQKYIKGVATQVKQKLGVGSDAKQVQAEFEKKAAQKKEEEQQNLLASIFKSVTKQTEAEEGEDPKSILCAYFKAGTCQKGKKCKYSHDMDVEGKSAKIDLYTDQRVVLFGKDGKEETMANWDEKTLVNAIEEKQKQYKSQKPTEIVCKYFLDAVENSKYGWFWVCPNGMNCIYRHCLPPGYVLKKDQIKENKDEASVEELIEVERAKLTTKGTPVTLERFLEWKAKKKEQRDAEENKKIEEAKKSGGKSLNLLSGRALFKFDPTLFADDDDAVEGADYDEREIEEEEKEAQNYDPNAEGSDDEEVKEEEDGEDEDNEGGQEDEPAYEQLEEGDENGNENEENGEEPEQIKIPEPEATTEKTEEVKDQAEMIGFGESKKKKKNRNKKKKAGEAGGDVKINEDVFLGEDGDLPDDLE
jgi:hypothetical protein